MCVIFASFLEFLLRLTLSFRLHVQKKFVTICLIYFYFPPPYFSAFQCFNWFYVLILSHSFFFSPLQVPLVSRQEQNEWDRAWSQEVVMKERVRERIRWNIGYPRTISDRCQNQVNLSWSVNSCYCRSYREKEEVHCFVGMKKKKERKKGER